MEPPFKPDIKDDTDVSYFDTDFTSENPELTPPDNSEERDMYSHSPRYYTTVALFLPFYLAISRRSP